MSPNKPPASSPAPTKEERLAKALRENLARRKALARAKRAREGGGPADAAAPTLLERKGSSGQEDEAPS